MHISYYTAVIHQKNATRYMDFSSLEEVYVYLSTITYMYADIRCNGILIHHKVGPCVPTCAPSCAPTCAPARAWHELVKVVRRWIKKLMH